MNNMRKSIANRHILQTMLLGLALAVSFTSCLDNDDETIILETPVNSTGIPDDALADPNPVLEDDPTTNVPNIQTTLDYIDDVPIIRIDMTGVKNAESTDWLRLYGTGSSEQNIWVEVDDVPKGIDVYNNSDKSEGRTIMTDVVFAVDNSGSMSEEADAIARDIISWSQQLANSGLSVRFGIVGYDGRITGGIDMTTAEELEKFLNYGSGTSRTMHFSNNRTDWSTLASRYFLNNSMDECGVAAIRLADENFNFRTGANRVYVNFTDEPNFPTSKSNFSVKYFESQDNWAAAQGTVHTVYSSSKFESNSWNVREQPWLVSEYTGGTTIFASSNFSGVTLASLPVTGAMENSYIIRFTNVEEIFDGLPHTVKITVKSAGNGGEILADKEYEITFVKSEE